MNYFYYATDYLKYKNMFKYKRLNQINVKIEFLPNQEGQIYEDDEWRSKTEEKEDIKPSWPIMAL